MFILEQTSSTLETAREFLYTKDGFDNRFI